LQRDTDGNGTTEPNHSTEPDHLPDPMLEKLRAAAAANADYRDLVAPISNEFPTPRDKTKMSVRRYWSIREALSVDNGIALFGRRIIVPQSARRELLEKLHEAHQGTYKAAGPAESLLAGISDEITFLVENCQPCQERLPHQQQEPRSPLARPLAHAGVQGRLYGPLPVQPAPLFGLAGGSASMAGLGWPVVHQWRHDPSAREVSQDIVESFTNHGFTARLRSANGPKFEAHAFQSVFRKWGVVWVNFTLCYSQRNGHAKAAVAAMKDLVAKIAPTGVVTSEAFVQGILEFRSTPRENNGLSPENMVFGHQLRSIIPAHRSSFKTRWQTPDSCGSKRSPSRTWRFH
jgi:hypothetical protein